jgi:hypothetical protein
MEFDVTFIGMSAGKKIPMTKPYAIEKLAVGNNLVDVVRNLRNARPLVIEYDNKKLLKSLAKDSCPQGLLLWAAIYGTTEMKTTVALNPAAESEALTALLLDALDAPWYVVSILERKDILKSFIFELFGDLPDLTNSSSLNDLDSACWLYAVNSKWKDEIPSQGACTNLQSELIRITWRFGKTLNYGVAYKLDYDDEMFTTLNGSVELLKGISLLTKCILHSLLRWSQLIQRGGSSIPPIFGYERTSFVGVIVAACLIREPEPISFPLKGLGIDSIYIKPEALSSPCPNCGGLIKETQHRYNCVGTAGRSFGCGFTFEKSPDYRTFATSEVERLLLNKKIGPLEGFMSNTGRPFAGRMELKYNEDIKNWKLDFDYSNEESSEIVDFSNSETLGSCPKCRSYVYEHASKYMCSKAVPTQIQPISTCDFNISTAILQQPLDRSQMSKLLSTGKTDLLTNLITTRTRKSFNAYLIWDAEGDKISFEFPPYKK